jgi:hypothetical protein
MSAVNLALLDDLLQIRHDYDLQGELLRVMLRSFFALVAVIQETNKADQTCVIEAASMLTAHYAIFLQTPWSPDSETVDCGHPLIKVIQNIADEIATDTELQALVERRAEVGADIAQRFEWFFIKLTAYAFAVENPEVA